MYIVFSIINFARHKTIKYNEFCFVARFFNELAYNKGVILCPTRCPTRKKLSIYYILNLIVLTINFHYKFEVILSWGAR